MGRKSHKRALRDRITEYFTNLIDNFGIKDPEASVEDVVHYLAHKSYSYTPTTQEMKFHLKHHPDIKHVEGTKKPKKYVYRPESLEDKMD